MASRAMKDSGVEWIGKIPKEWNIKKMSLLADKITDYVASGSFASLKKNVNYLSRPDYAMLIRTVDLSGSSNKQPVYVDKSAYEFLSNSNLFGGELVLSNIGSVGNVYMYTPMYKRATLAPNSIMVNMKGENRFYYYWFLNPIVNETLKLIGSDSVQTKFNKTQLRAFKVVEPPFEEQQKVAAFLDEKASHIDNIIENTKKSIENLKAYKQSLITETVTKGLDPNVVMKNSGVEWVGEIPSHWRVNKLKRIFEIKKNIAKQLGYDILSVTQKGLKIKDISNNEGQLSADYSKYQIVEENDFVMNHMDLLTGWVDLSKFEGVTSPDYRVFKSSKPNIINNLFYKYIFQLGYSNKIFYGLGQGVSNKGRWRLPTDQFLNFEIPIPPIEEQHEIAIFLNEKTSHVNLLIEQKEQLINELESYKKSFIYEYVTGKKEVK